MPETLEQLLFWPNYCWMRDLALTSNCLSLFIVASRNYKHILRTGIEPGTYLMESNISTTEPCSPLDVQASIMHDRWLMAKNSLNMMEKMMDPNVIDYDIINCAIQSIFTIQNLYQIDFGKPDGINEFVNLFIVLGWIHVNQFLWVCGFLFSWEVFRCIPHLLWPIYRRFLGRPLLKNLKLRHCFIGI